MMAMTADTAAWILAQPVIFVLGSLYFHQGNILKKDPEGMPWLCWFVAGVLFSMNIAAFATLVIVSLK